VSSKEQKNPPIVCACILGVKDSFHILPVKLGFLRWTVVALRFAFVRHMGPVAFSKVKRVRIMSRILDLAKYHLLD
jgi:hypothetical protein